jgi:hypothetical protein
MEIYLTLKSVDRFNFYANFVAKSVHVARAPSSKFGGIVAQAIDVIVHCVDMNKPERHRLREFNKKSMV